MPRRLGIFLWLALAAGLPGRDARAEVVPHLLFTDGVVLQRDRMCPVWGTASPGEEVTLELTRGADSLARAATRAGKDGHWLVEWGKFQAGGPYTLTIAGAGADKVVVRDVYVGEVWVCSGQSNMEMALVHCDGAEEAIAHSADELLHLFTMPRRVSDKPLGDVPLVGQRSYVDKPGDKPVDDVKGQWKECAPVTVKNFSAVAYYFGRHLRKTLGVPVGLIHASWGGTPAEAWTPRAALTAVPDLKGLVEDYDKTYPRAVEKYPQVMEKYKADREKYKQAVAEARENNQKPPPAPPAPEDPRGKPNRPSVLYNGMIHPLQPFALRGAIWYQGESNTGAAHLYRTLFPTLIHSWRDTWKCGDFPFLFVQLAPFQAIRNEPMESNWAELREAQLLTSRKVPHTAMAVITDVGDPNDVHPRKKEPVGDRLALAARALAYGEKVEYSGPVFDKLKVDGSRAILTFTHTGQGLEARDGALQGFTVAGEDHKFHNATARIEGDTVVVTCEQVDRPVAVRYGWAHCPVVNLWNKDGLPASPFRTDDFPMVTGPKPKRSADGK